MNANQFDLNCNFISWWNASHAENQPNQVNEVNFAIDNRVCDVCIYYYVSLFVCVFLISYSFVIRMQSQCTIDRKKWMDATEHQQQHRRIKLTMPIIKTWDAYLWKN